MSPGFPDEARSQVLRRRLFEAAGIVTVARHALASNLHGLNDESVIDALAAAARLVDEVAAALEGR